MDRIPALRRVILADVTLAGGALWAAAAVAVPTALRWLIDRGEAGIPFVTYYPAIVLAALLLGWRWGAVVAAVSGVAANWLFIGEPLRFGVSLRDSVLVALFIVSCAALVWIGDMARRMLRRLEAAKAREELLNAELLHRVKNMLATVNAVAVLTARHSEPGQFAQAFNGRMRALGKAADLLASGREMHCEVRRLVDSALEPFRTDHNFAIEGAPCELPRDACVPLSLALHELATNAVKHGALSADGGRVELRWACDHDRTLALEWCEQGGPPVPEVRRTGMGTQLLRRQQGLRAVEVEFRRDGLWCRIEIDGATPVAAPAERAA